MISYSKYWTLLALTYAMLHITDAMAQYTPVQNVEDRQNTIDTLHKNRLNALIIGGSATYVIGSVGLYHAWYKDYPQSSFHFYNDYHEWLQMDKMGHIYSSYAQADRINSALRWTGLDSRRSANYSALSALVFQSTIEVMDGLSEGWGFSLIDMTANVVGTSLWYTQHRLWGEQKVRMKYSSTIKKYDSTGPINLEDRGDDLYGTNLPQRLLKDYNAQTIWLSANLQSITGTEAIPAWLNLAVGYGAENLYGGYENRWQVNGEWVDASSHERYRQYYLSLDVDLSRIKTRHRWLRTILKTFNSIKVPFPAIELTSQGRVRFSPLQF